MKPVVVADYKNIVGEGPLWHPKKNILFWIDIMAGRIFTLDPSTGDHSLFHQAVFLVDLHSRRMILYCYLWRKIQ